jgi:hypothetical protein
VGAFFLVINSVKEKGTGETDGMDLLLIKYVINSVEAATGKRSDDDDATSGTGRVWVFDRGAIRTIG